MGLTHLESYLSGVNFFLCLSGANIFLGLCRASFFLGLRGAILSYVLAEQIFSLSFAEKGGKIENGGVASSESDSICHKREIILIDKY